MSTIQAQELFYSRVEAAFSPKGRSGYQVVYHTPGLSAADIDMLEARLSCFEGGSVDIRYQYFHVGDQIALAASQAIDEIDSRITDRSGRGGAFVAHSYLISRADFALVDNNPFAVFDDEPFILSPQAMIEAKEAAESTRLLTLEPPAPVDYANLCFDSDGWTADEFSKLFGLAAQARGLIQARKSVSIRADPTCAVPDFLRVLFDVLPSELRLACTFDTFAQGCVPLPGVYWAFGETGRSANANISQVRFDRQSIDLSPGVTNNSSLASLAAATFHTLRRAQGYEPVTDTLDQGAS